MLHMACGDLNKSDNLLLRTSETSPFHAYVYATEAVIMKLRIIVALAVLLAAAEAEGGA